MAVEKRHVEYGPDVDFAFSADVPIKGKEEDLLGRAGFAEALAKGFRGWKGKESLVVALSGEWGTGKTSLKNMVVQCLTKPAEDNPYLVQFNPWAWAGTEELGEAFFREVGLTLRTKYPGKTEKIAGRLEKYWDVLTVTKEIAENLEETVKNVLVGIILVSGLIGYYLEHKVFFFYIPILTAVLIFFSKGVAAILGTIIRRLRAKALNTTLEDFKRGLVDLFKDSPKPLIVILDDIDRLEKREVRALFRLIKVNADFPNTVYFLLFQKDLVATALGQEGLGNGEAFLEKIIQVPFDLPRIDESSLVSIFTKDVDRILNNLPASNVEALFSEGRWVNIYSTAIRYLFKNIRDIKRFTNSYEFHIRMFVSQGYLNVNVIDLLLLELLRLRAPSLYKGIYENKFYFTSGYGLQSVGGGREDSVKRIIEGLTNAIEGDTAGYLREIVIDLFPNIGWVFGKPLYNGSYSVEWLNQLRICHKDNFDRYFKLALAETAITADVIDALIELSSDKERLKNELRNIQERGVLEGVLTRLNARSVDIPLENAGIICEAVFDLGEEFITLDNIGDFMGIRLLLNRLVRDSLRRIPDEADRVRVLAEAIQNSDGLFLPVDFVRSLIPEDETRRESHPDYYVISEVETESLKELCISRVRAAADSGVLINNVGLAWIIYRWREWGGIDEPSKWAKNLIKDSDQILLFVKSFLTKSTVTSLTEYHEKTEWFLDIDIIDEFIPIDSVYEMFDGYDRTQLDSHSETAVDTFLYLYRRKSEGKPYDRLSAYMDDD